MKINQSDYFTGDDLEFLKGITEAVIRQATILPGEKNHTGVTNTNNFALIQPGGKYGWFWIRDYAMSLDCGLIAPEQQFHMLMYTAEHQSDSMTELPSGSRIPPGAISDRISLDGTGVFFPSTPELEFGLLPPFDNHFFFIHMAWHLIIKHGRSELAEETINGKNLLCRLKEAFAMPPERAGFKSVFCDDSNSGISFGFYDVIPQSGFLLFASVLKCRAAQQLSQIFDVCGDAEKAAAYSQCADVIMLEIPLLFGGGQGLPRSATGRNAMPDIWGAAYGIYAGVITGDMAERISDLLAAAYEEGTLAYRGFIRHVLTSDDYSKDSAWEFLCREYPNGKYQNGAYWGTPTGWVAEAVALTHPEIAQKLILDYMHELKESDFRKESDLGGPYECFHPDFGLQNPVYMTSVSCPLASFMKLIN